MNKIKILTIGTDRSLLEEGSVAFNRQVEYYKNFERADILVLGQKQKVILEKNNVRIISYGGSNRVVNFIKTFFSYLGQLLRKNYQIIYVQDVMYCGIMGYYFNLYYKIFSKILFLKNRTQQKFITQIHGDYLDNSLWIDQRKENIFLNFFGKFLAKRSDYVRCVSNRIVEYMHDKLKIDKSKLVSLPIGINGDEFNTVDVDMNKRNKQIIFCGRLIPEKEPLFFCDIVIPVLKKYSDYTVVFIGEGYLKDEILKKFADAGLLDKVFMAGFLNARAVSRYYKAGFCNIHTAFWEGWGLPMVEASACGLPVITTDNGCAGEVILDGVNGIVRDTKDATIFTEALESIIIDRNLYNKMCENGARLATEWTFKSMRDKTEKFLESAVK